MTVYLLHFDEAIGNPSTPHGMARHYIGWSPEPTSRIARHASGDGAKIIRFVMEAGIGFVVAQTWEGGPELEKRLKRQKCAPRFCRVCQEERREQRERDELLAQMDWEREVLGRAGGGESDVTLGGWDTGPFGDSIVEAERSG